jgi:ribosomal protein S18 acetylase RimI-like enzyme
MGGALISPQGLGVEILDLRHFSSADLRPLLYKESAEWMRALCWDYSGSAEMVLRYMDAKILPGYAAVESGRVHGFSFFVYEGSKGVIGDLFVDRDAGGTAATETTLLKHVLETLQGSPGVHRIEAQLLLHEAGALAAPFLDAGFIKHPRLFMRLPIAPPAPAHGQVNGNGHKKNGHVTPEEPIPTELELRRWSEEEFQGAATIITTAYRNHVDSDINDQYRTVAGSMRFLNNIVRFPGCGVFDPDASFVVRNRNNRSVVGLILCSMVKPDVGHVTQICVAPEYRGKGIASSLIATACADMRRRKFTALTLTVTQANANAVELYKKLGFSVTRVFDAFVWEG